MGFRYITIKKLLVSENSLNDLLFIDSMLIFLSDTGTPENTITLLYEVNDGETVSICSALYFYSSASCSTEVSTIFYMTLNSALSSTYTAVAYIIGFPHTYEEKGDRNLGRYNSTTRGTFNGESHNGNICQIYASIEPFGFEMDVLGSKRRSTTVKKFSMTALQHILTPSFITVDMFALVVPYLFAV